jgi:hypothetical protein
LICSGFRFFRDFFTSRELRKISIFFIDSIMTDLGQYRPIPFGSFFNTCPVSTRQRQTGRGLHPARYAE